MRVVDGMELRRGGLSFTTRGVGPDGGPLVVLLHGFPDTPGTFDALATALADAGHRVVVPTIRGYEPSSQPEDGDYELTTLAGDVVAWLDALGVERAHLVGHDWGAAIAYVTAGHHPDRVASLTTMAVPPLARLPQAVRRVPFQIARSWYMTFFQIPWLAERSVRARDFALLRRLWTSWSPGLEVDDRHWDDLRAHFGRPGVVEAALAYYRTNARPPELLGLRATAAMSRPTIPVPTLILHGADDACLDRRLYDHAVLDADFPAGVFRHELTGAGHFLHLERPERVAELVLDHLTRSATEAPR